MDIYSLSYSLFAVRNEFETGRKSLDQSILGQQIPIVLTNSAHNPLMDLNSPIIHSSLTSSTTLTPLSENYQGISTLESNLKTLLEEELLARVNKTCSDISGLSIMINFVGMDSNVISRKIGNGFNFILNGGYQSVMNARGLLLQQSPFMRASSISLPRAEVFDGTKGIKPEMRKKLDEITSLTKTHYTISGEAEESLGYGLEREKNLIINLAGSFEAVEQSRVRILVLLDELNGLHSEICEIDYKLHNIVGGRKRNAVRQIQEETGTNIYFPTPFSGILAGSRDPNLLNQNIIFITGEFLPVQRAKNMLFSIAQSKVVISRDIALLPRKLDWILLEKLEEIKQIMIDNGTFINWSSGMIGSQGALISIYGDDKVNIERTIRSIMEMACQFLIASIWLLPTNTNFDVFSPPIINLAQISPHLRHIAITTGVEISFKANFFEIFGTEAAIRAATLMIISLEYTRGFRLEIRFQIELANEKRDFISGKKNGKLNKIMKSTNSRIKFSIQNDYNFTINLSGNAEALNGLTMLFDELPAEISFQIPEFYHKRIIGIAGKNIQRIMKKFGVYVKFSNAEDFALLGGYEKNSDNCLARTPAKNSSSLENLKSSIMELVNAKDKDFVQESVLIPRRHHRILLSEKSIFLHDIERKTNSEISFPPNESASEIVLIYSPESQVQTAITMLLDHVPLGAQYRLPHSVALTELLSSTGFSSLINRIKRDLNITILPLIAQNGGEDSIIKFILTRSNTDFLETARELVEEFLVQHQIELYPSINQHDTHSSSSSFSFQHFNNAILSEEPRRLRRGIAASSPNIKALFEAPPSVPYHRISEDFLFSPPLPTSILSPESISSYEESRWSQGFSTGHTGYPSPASTTSSPSVKAGARLSHDELSFRQIRSTGTPTNRATSLDLSSTRPLKLRTSHSSVDEVSLLGLGL